MEELERQNIAEWLSVQKPSTPDPAPKLNP